MPILRTTRRKLLLLLLPLALLLAVALWLWRPWARPIPIVIVEGVNPIDGAAMVWVPTGTFIRGRTLGDYLRLPVCAYLLKLPRLFVIVRDYPSGTLSPDTPARRIDLDGYWIYTHPVTVAQYRAFCAATGRELPPWPGDRYSWAGKSGWADPALQGHPIVNVTWDDATAYAAWAGVSLPTEAQWEKAARGPVGRAYPWGNAWDATKCANRDNSYKQEISTWPVGSFPAGMSPYGAHDMAGNVWELCADWYGDEYYKNAPARNPTGPAIGDWRVLRGGSWDNNNPGYFRASYRLSIDPSGGSDVFGFRCVSHSPGP